MNCAWSLEKMMFSKKKTLESGHIFCDKVVERRIEIFYAKDFLHKQFSSSCLVTIPRDNKCTSCTGRRMSCPELSKPDLVGRVSMCFRVDNRHPWERPGVLVCLTWVATSVAICVFFWVLTLDGFQIGSSVRIFSQKHWQTWLNLPR